MAHPAERRVAPMTEEPVCDLLEAFQKLSNEIGGQLCEGKAFPINEKTLEQVLGEDYNELIEGMYSAEYIVPGIDEMKDNIFEIWFTSTGLAALKQRGKQIQEDRLATQKRQAEQAATDAKLLIRYFRPKKPDEAVKITLEKVGQVLAEPSEENLQKRLDLLYTTNYLAANLCGKDEYEITFYTKGVELSREEPKPPRQVHRQITIEGKQIDVRNRANFDLLNARIEDVENLSQSYLHQMRSQPTKRQRRRLTCELQRVMTLRGKDLSRPLYGSVCLRLGMPLPADFWHLPPEMLPKNSEKPLVIVGM
jgi:hypothetical protein